jgi:hypothetical protein
VEIQGRPGELVDRLMTLIRDDPEFDPNWWADIGVVVASLIGGIEPEPLTEPPPPPGSAGAKMRERYGAASKEDYTGLLRDRLMELVSLGVSEDFLVRAARNELARWMTAMADTGEADRRRAAMRESMREIGRDPQGLTRYREVFARTNPEAAQWSDDQIAERLREMASKPLLDATTADTAIDRWAAKSHFDRRAEQLLAEAEIERWVFAAGSWSQ